MLEIVIICNCELLNKNVLLIDRINVRVEHVTHSKCRTDFLDRVQENEKLKREAKIKGIRVVCKRQVIIE